MNVRVGLLLVVLPGLVTAQATVEYATGAAVAATATVPAQKAGKAIAGAFSNLNRVLQNADNSEPAAQRATTPQSRRPQQSAKASTPEPQSASGAIQAKEEPSFEDPSGIQEAMEYAEILHRFGPPSLKLTTGSGEETLNYVRKDVVVNAILRNGKVASVQKTGGADQSHQALSFSH
jgi:hypothetical protein